MEALSPGASTLPAATPHDLFDSTPEITPRHADMSLGFMDGTTYAAAMHLSLIVAPAAATSQQLQVEVEPACTGPSALAAAALESSSTNDGFSDEGSAADQQYRMCWDLEPTPRVVVENDQQVDIDDASSSIHGSTSRSARRRRGRRAAKQAVVAAQRINRGIPEAPQSETLLVSQEKRLDLIRQIEQGGQATHSAVNQILDQVLRMSMEAFGCRVVQAALDKASSAQKERITAELHSHVRQLIGSPHGNFVIQKVVEVLPSSSFAFVTDELVSFAVETAQHRFGCRVLSRLVEHLSVSSKTASTALLLDEILSDIDKLIRHNFARHVIELILEHGTDAHRQAVCRVIQQRPCYYAKDRCASYVVEKALASSSGRNVNGIVSKLLSDSEQFLELGMHECGMHVANAVSHLRGDSGHRARTLIAKNRHRLVASKYGIKLIELQGKMEQVAWKAERW